MSASQALSIDLQAPMNETSAWTLSLSKRITPAGRSRYGRHWLRAARVEGIAAIHRQTRRRSQNFIKGRSDVILRTLEYDTLLRHRHA